MPRHLLLCLDAFGTIFIPKRPVAEQYAAIARQCGLKDIRTAQVDDAFRSAFAKYAALHPNYGRATGMGAERWWSEVIFFPPLFFPVNPVTLTARMRPG